MAEFKHETGTSRWTLCLWWLDIPYGQSQEHAQNQSDQSTNKNIAQSGSYRASTANSQRNSRRQTSPKTAPLALTQQFFLFH
jgi:hypothetical protein